MSGAKVYFRNEKTTDTWLTPLDLIRPLGEFDLDPCAYPDHPTAKSLLCLPFDDGLTAEWTGRVWLNPPYGGECASWMERLADHGCGTALVFARTETKWFQNIIARASAALFPKGRIHFLKPDGTYGAGSSAPSVFIAFGDDDATKLLFSGIPGWALNL